MSFVFRKVSCKHKYTQSFELAQILTVEIQLTQHNVFDWNDILKSYLFQFMFGWLVYNRPIYYRVEKHQHL